MVKLIAIDLDGTLLNERNEISNTNLEAIKSAQANEVEVVIATGRAHFDVQSIFQATGINTWIIGANGATIHQPNGELFHSTPIDKEDSSKIFSWLEQENFYYEILSNQSIFAPKNGRDLLAVEIDRIISANKEVSTDDLHEAVNKQFSQTGITFMDTYHDLTELDIDFYNVLAFSFHEEKLGKGWEHFKQFEGLSIVKSAHHNFELEHRNASKGNALKMLTNKLNIDISNTAAVGDNYNDLSMLQLAGKSAAMGNAPSEIKESCNEITLSNTEDGVAHFIYSFI